MSIKWYQLLFQIVNFTILIYLLNRFLYRPIVQIINQRNEKIEASIKAAESNLKEKAKIEELKKIAVKEAEKEAIDIIEAAKKQAGKSGRNILEKAKKETQNEIDKKYQLLLEKLNDQENRLKSKIASLVVDTTSQVLKNSLSVKDQESIINNQIKNLKKTSNK